MAYVKTVWETGDVITAEKLNNMEGGIEAQDPIILLGVYDANDDTITFDISAADMFSAIEAGKKVILHYPKAGIIAEAFSNVLFISRASDGSDGYEYQAGDIYQQMINGSGSFSADNAAYVVTISGE